MDISTKPLDNNQHKDGGKISSDSKNDKQISCVYANM